ncbi:MAG: hypothetical protein JW748_08305 [Anaerolineales bacterium]|nr:hypothetical protein [Anaerolineales bacterium]
MSIQKKRQIKVDTNQFYVLSPILPYIDIIFRSINIHKKDYSKTTTLIHKFQEDPRMVEVVHKCGDASAKVPYLIEAGETKESILKTLRGIADPHVEYLNRLPEKIQTTIHLLLSINILPRGCEELGIPALLEIDRIQREMIGTLRGLMEDRPLAKAFHENNRTALQMLDRDWPRIREEKTCRFSTVLLPELAQTQYKPTFDKEGWLKYIHETCVIVDSPDAKILRPFIPAVLQDPYPASEPIPVMGSADWLIVNVGKIGRHLTRALLGIIKERLETEQIPLEKDNYELINQRALETLHNYVEKMP